MFKPRKAAAWWFITGKAVTMAGMFILDAYPSDIHNRIIDCAFPGLDRGQRDVLKRASARVDNIRNGGQSEANAFMHAMRAPSESVQEAASRMAEFVSSNEDAARRLQSQAGSERISDGALDRFGNALHTLSDATSPAHAGFQVWDYNPIHVRSHIRREANVEAEKTEVRRAISAARQAFGEVFGMKFLGQAIGTADTCPEFAPNGPASDNRR